MTSIRAGGRLCLPASSPLRFPSPRMITSCRRCRSQALRPIPSAPGPGPEATSASASVCLSQPSKEPLMHRRATLQSLGHRRGPVTQPEPCEWDSPGVTKPFAGPLWAAWRDLRSRKCLPVVSTRTRRGGAGRLCHPEATRVDSMIERDTQRSPGKAPQARNNRTHHLHSTFHLQSLEPQLSN